MRGLGPLGGSRLNLGRSGLGAGQLGGKERVAEVAGVASVAGLLGVSLNNALVRLGNFLNLGLGFIVRSGLVARLGSLGGGSCNNLCARGNACGGSDGKFLGRHRHRGAGVCRVRTGGRKGIGAVGSRAAQVVALGLKRCIARLSTGNLGSGLNGLGGLGSGIGSQHLGGLRLGSARSSLGVFHRHAALGSLGRSRGGSLLGSGAGGGLGCTALAVHVALKGHVAGELALAAERRHGVHHTEHRRYRRLVAYRARGVGQHKPVEDGRHRVGQRHECGEDGHDP